MFLTTLTFIVCTNTFETFFKIYRMKKGDMRVSKC